MVRNLLLVFGMSRVTGWGGWQTLIAVCVGLTVASQAAALGLGEIELDSALNERLDAEIELLDASGLQPTEILVSLASNEDFKRIGVERFFFLTDLQFEVAYGPGGGATVQVTSSRPITEPYLNFIVEVMWPSGRLLKEYIVLLDPPTFSQAAVPRVSAPTTPAPVARTAGRIERSQTARSADQVRVVPARPREPQSSSPVADDGNYRMTDRNDTLWTIASDTRVSGAITVQQNMLAIQRLNPRAFIRNNINLLKAGYVLRLPSESEALSLTTRQAVQEVAVQTEAWQAGRRGAQLAQSAADQPAPRIAETDPEELREQLDATPSAEVAVAETTLTEGQLRIVAGRGTAASGGADAANASEQINAALEEQDRLTREVDELTYQLDREQELATSQLAVKDRQLQVKDQQIAELQAQMAEIQQGMQDLAAQNQNQNISTQASVPWWQSPYVLGAGLAVLVLLLVVVMIRARRAREATDELYAEPIVARAEEPVVSQAMQAEEEPEEEETAAESSDSHEQDDEDVQTADEPASDDADEFRDSDEQAEEESEIQGVQTSDVIGEADIYIAYGRYPQAIALLLGVIDEAPERNDVRLKLLELYVETHDKEAFNTHMVGLLERCDDEDALLFARELEGRISESDLAVDAPLEGVPGGEDSVLTDLQEEPEASATIDEFHLDLDNEEEQGAQIQDGEDVAEDTVEDGEGDGTAGDFALELDDFDGAEDSQSAEGSQPAEGSDDGDLTLEDMDTETAEDSSDDLGGDLGIDFDPHTDVEEPEAATEASPAAEESLEDMDTLNLDDIEFDSEMAEDAAAAEDEELASEVASAEEDEFEFADEADSANTKLDLARAYIDMGDEDGARDILKEVITEGNAEQQQQAEKLLESI